MGVVKFKTSGRGIPMIPRTGKIRVIHQDAEFGFPEDQLDAIEQDWNNGMDFLELAEKEGRTQKEILFALMELAEEDRIKRPMGYIY
ncbi:hypothetical protein [Oceanobacillus sp. FSL W7-1281]|uniref:hypothetical protein n=1 Tax=Oceanobacillus sp. FSL W7-1281 TaxID=2921698 RepID=UPI0030DB8336